MTAPENFVSRWARLKRASGIEPEADPDGIQLDSAASVVAETPPPRQEGEVVDDPFDPASLPSIATITGDTDIRGFLQSRVPAALTRAALRQAWASDPAIRDFIGIAENQWDFNDPTAMPGFGPMLETDNLPKLLARAMGDRDKFADMIPEIPAPVENGPPSAAHLEISTPDQRMSERLSAADEMSSLPDDSDENTATRDDGVAEEAGSSRSHRSHGGALPR
ncbi:DUF3306 domain-containing protein [Bradyrhizobium sp. dw_411]|uniref:DUF3306 domain-containing protein n=1 Tax=Bradyrhizobium sp. dw_411 TaxID=2720082 RepID=UPI001BCCA5C2|nr:DUF3306 domain-containing protein [Bradyrhizobium sp. dw_411]